MAVYTVFKSLRLDIEVKSVLDPTHCRSIYDRGYYSDSEDEELNSFSQIRKLGDVVVTYAGGYEGDSPQDIIDSFGGKAINVLWLTKPLHANVGMVHLTVSFPIPACRLD